VAASNASAQIGRVEYLKATFVLAVFSSALLAALDLLLVQFSAFAERVRSEGGDLARPRPAPP
jgi:hypothetical protein